MGEHGKYRSLVAAGLVWAAIWLFASAPAWAACRQALVLGLDISGSVDGREYNLQVEGLARALTDREVAAKILAQPEAPVSLYVFEWSGPGVQRPILGWTVISDLPTLQAAAAQIANHRRQLAVDRLDRSTAIRPALAHGVAALEEKARCWKRTIDISGDGVHNTGGEPRSMRPALAAAGITVNGLVIGIDSPRGGDIRQLEIGELSSYYHAQVIHGPDAFVETALGFSDFERAMRRKLLRELESIVIGFLE